jgi:hypothetical protein
MIHLLSQDVYFGKTRRFLEVQNYLLSNYNNVLVTCKALVAPDERKFDTSGIQRPNSWTFLGHKP